MQFGVVLPTFTWPGLDYAKTRVLVKEFAQRAEHLGFDSLSVWDHLLAAPGLYGGSWLEPLTTLAYAAACTERVKVGTNILVAPIRHPVLLAKEVATLDYMSGGRFFLGIGPGWNPPEFSALNINMKQRGGRTDEILDALRQLLTREHVSFAGKYFRFEDVTIDPLPPQMPEVWVAGGSRIPDPLSPDKPYMVRTVLDRIARHADVFTVRASGNREFVRRDIQTVQNHLRHTGRDPSTLRYSHVQALYAVETTDHEEALRLQRPHFERLMGRHRSFEHLQECYLLGTIDEVVTRLQELEQAGLQHVAIHPAAPEIEQLDLWAARIVPRLR